MDIIPSLRIDSGAQIPIAAQLADQIAWLIASGRIEPDDQLPPIRHLATALGVNMHTVRAVYQQLEADGLVASRRGVGTTVLRYDRAVRATHTPDVPTFTIGVLIPGHNPFYNPFLNAIEDAARDAPLMTFIGNTHNDAREVARYLDQMVSKNVDGIIIASFGPPDYLAYGDALPPVVYADIPGAPAPCVVFDADAGGYLAGSHLLEHGHTRIGLITPPVEWANVAEVYAGFLRALDERGLALPPELVAVTPGYTPEAGHVAAEQLLDQPDLPTAIFAAGVSLAVGAIQAVKGRGMRVPEDVALQSYDDTDVAALVEPPISSVHLPAGELGRQAMSMLQTLMAGGEVQPDRLILPTHLVVRRSCGCDGSAHSGPSGS